MAEKIPNHPQYYATLINFLSFSDGVQHHKDLSFTPQKLGQIHPQLRWMCSKHIVGRSSSLEYYKKVISNYMPNKLMPDRAHGVRSKSICDADHQCYAQGQAPLIMASHIQISDD